MTDERKWRERGERIAEKMKLETQKEIEEKCEKIDKKIKKLYKEKIMWEAVYYTLRKKMAIMQTKALPIGTEVKYRGIPLMGPGVKIAGKVGKLKAIKRKFAEIDYGNLGVWNIPLQDVVVIDDPRVKDITPDIVAGLNNLLNNNEKK